MSDKPGIQAPLQALFRQRLVLVQAAAASKTSVGQAQAPARVAEVMANVRAAAQAARLDPDLLERTYRQVVTLFIAHEASALAARLDHTAALSAAPAPEPRPAPALADVRAGIDALDRDIVAVSAVLGPSQTAAAALLAAAQAVVAG
jgi:isochorismate pyruvate lyase